MNKLKYYFNIVTANEYFQLLWALFMLYIGFKILING